MVPSAGLILGDDLSGSVEVNLAEPLIALIGQVTLQGLETLFLNQQCLSAESGVCILHTFPINVVDL